MDESNENFLDLMYQDAPAVPLNPGAAPVAAIMNMPAMSHAIRALQRESVEQKAVIESLRREVRILRSQLRGTQHVVRNAQGRIGDLDHALDGKIDRRDF